jgi:2-haloacid dehalogenase
LAREAERLGAADGKLLHVAQSLFHRRHDRPGRGATPAPPVDVTPDWTFASMGAFADAVDAENP